MDEIRNDDTTGLGTVGEVDLRGEPLREDPWSPVGQTLSERR